MPINIKKYIIGEPLKTSQIHHEKYSVFKGLPILSSDAISSVAYAGEEILWVLIPAIGLLSYRYLFYVTISIVVLLSILIFSYRQTIESYPRGGGSYIVSKDNLGTTPSLIAAASLTIDYILTVAVSATAGVAAITSAFPALLPFKITITLLIVLLMAIGNLRGISESAKIFSVPTYFFLFMCLLMIVYGLIKFYVFGYVSPPVTGVSSSMTDVSILLLLRAFSSGCTALTGIEAVSDGVPNFKEPATKSAKTVLSLLFLIIVVIFGGVSYLSTIYHAVPSLDKTVISQIAEQVFGKGGILFYLMQLATTLILIMAANTAFSDLPLLLSFIARDGYAPRQLGKRGDRLSYSNGIIALSVAAATLVILFRGENHFLLPLYAVGVFISFTLSQTGMVVKWYRSRSKVTGWIIRASINGFGALITFITAIIIAINKFTHGAWLIFVLLPLLITVMKWINRHYRKVAKQLSLENNYFPKFDCDTIRRFIIPIAGLNESVIKAINYAKCLSNDITAFHVSVSDEETKVLEEKWKKYKMDIPLIVTKSEYREIVEPLLSYIESKEFPTKEHDIVTVVIPQFVVGHWWGNILHNQTAFFIRSTLIKSKNISVISVPFVIEDDEE
ncbi:amino acid permease [Clostridium polyendosporum]|uniref:Amino acid permease n=1 Tax=Clostridium polyendosporum TaxID=69208 RepID=A0A919RZT9_9CLOT|nr:amino acid permease [Clostridium polyendosporum]